MAGFKKVLDDYPLVAQNSFVLQCTNDDEENYLLLTGLMQGPQKPDGVIASVEKLITPFYRVCRDLNLTMPADVKLVGFSNLPTASILRPALSTITQPAFSMGKTAATVLFNALEKPNYQWQEEDIVIPSEIYFRESTTL